MYGGHDVVMFLTFVPVAGWRGCLSVCTPASAFLPGLRCTPRTFLRVK